MYRYLLDYIEMRTVCLKLSVISWQLLLCAPELDYETALISLCLCIEEVVCRSSIKTC